ncbi:hypothetical protein E0H54_23285 [Rhizobium leguminosarum bv. viciae]|nr:hypothetical protein E0H54_23285 [Rhizobium leguminosarum bv. viciae]
MPCKSLWGTERSRHIPFAPFTGRRCRQADEGLLPPGDFIHDDAGAGILSDHEIKRVAECFQNSTAAGNRRPHRLW